MPSETVESLRHMLEIGSTRYENFFDDRIASNTTTWTSTLKRTNLSLFSDRAKPCKEKSEVSLLKEERVKVIAMMHAASSGRNIEDVLSSESSDHPPAFTRAGKMHHGTKSDLLTCLESEIPELPLDRPHADVIINDGSVIVHLLRPNQCVTFGDFIDTMFLPYINQQLDRACRVDNVWDKYMQNSLKLATREARQSKGGSIRRKVTLSTKIPGNWSGFLRVDQNKSELYGILAESVHNMPVPPGKQVITTLGDNVLINPLQDSNTLSPCSHEEADSRMLLHVADAMHHGYRHIMIRTNDSDVVAISVSSFPSLTSISELWIAIGTGNKYRYIPIHILAQQLGPDKCKALSVFQPWTGSDFTSSFYGVGKKTAWAKWMGQPDVTAAFKYMASSPAELPEWVLNALELFAVHLYAPDLIARGITTVNAARYDQFYYKGKDFDHIPPTKDALLQHSLRATYIGGHVWGQALIRCPELPDPSSWGWQKENDKWVPVWVTLPSISQKLKSLNRCGCKVACKPPCKCFTGSQKCTSLCYCRGECFGKRNEF